MRRYCDGTDVYLLRWVGNKFVPCDCHLRFDDANRETVYPHRSLTREERYIRQEEEGK